MALKQCLYAMKEQQLIKDNVDKMFYMDTMCYTCDHSKPHNQKVVCMIKCCGINHKDVRCVNVE